jgi:O-antigen/teichoic acid export membrane protein
MSNLLKTFIKASLWSAGTTYLFFAINFIGQVFLARNLLPWQFGVYAFAFAVQEFALVFLGFSTTQGFIYTDGGQKEFNACLRLNLVAFFFFSLVGVVGGLVLLSFYNMQYAMMFFALCISQGFLLLGAVYLAPLERALNYKVASTIRGTASSLSLFVALIIAWQTHSLWSLAIRNLLQGLFLLLMGLWVAPMRYQRGLKGTSVKTQLQFGIKTSISRGLEVLYYRFPDAIINIFLGKVALGNFYQARYLAFMPIKLTIPFTEGALFSFFTRLKKDPQKLSDYLSWINYITLRLLLPATVLILLYGKTLFIFVYGKAWTEAGNYFQFFALFALFAPLFNALQSACYSLKAQWAATCAYLLGIVLFASGVFFSTRPEYAALYFSLGFLVGYLFMLLALTRHHIRIKLYPLFCFPTIILITSLASSLHYLPKTTALILSLVFLIVMYFIERKKLFHLVKKIIQRKG